MFIGLRSIGESISRVWANAGKGGFVLSLFESLKTTLKDVGIALAVTGKVIGLAIEQFVWLGDQIQFAKLKALSFFESLKISAQSWIDWIAKSTPFKIFTNLTDIIIPNVKAVIGGFFEAIKSKFEWLQKLFSRFVKGLSDVFIPPVPRTKEKPEFDFLGNVTNDKNSGGNARANGSGSGIGLNQQMDKVVSGGGSIKNVNVHIERLIEHFKIETTQISQSTEAIKEVIIKVLNDAVNDVNYAN